MPNPCEFLWLKLKMLVLLKFEVYPLYTITHTCPCNRHAFNITNKQSLSINMLTIKKSFTFYIFVQKKKKLKNSIKFHNHIGPVCDYSIQNICGIIKC